VHVETEPARDAALAETEFLMAHGLPSAIVCAAWLDGPEADVARLAAQAKPPAGKRDIHRMGPKSSSITSGAAAGRRTISGLGRQSSACLEALQQRQHSDAQGSCGSKFSSRAITGIGFPFSNTKKISSLGMPRPDCIA
jgi:hypothetical protein